MPNKYYISLRKAEDGTVTWHQTFIIDLELFSAYRSLLESDCEDNPAQAQVLRLTNKNPNDR